MRDSRRKDFWFPALVLALLAIGLATRIYGAWCFRFNLNPDASVVALMVKHMAEGRDFPVFFYGQAYMGTFEPMVSAALCRLFGCSGFMVCLGTALLGFCTLPFIYRWARDLDSRRRESPRWPGAWWVRTAISITRCRPAAATPPRCFSALWCSG